MVPGDKEELTFSPSVPLPEERSLGWCFKNWTLVSTLSEIMGLPGLQVSHLQKPREQ